MKSSVMARLVVITSLLTALITASALPDAIVAAQSGRQPPQKKVEKKTEDQKKSGQPTKPEEQELEEPVPPIPRGQKDEPPLKLSTQVVSIDVTVKEKKTGRLIPNLAKQNFIVYEDGVKQEVTNLSSGEGPITVVLLLENNFRNRYYTSYYDPTFAEEIFRSAAVFVQGFVKPRDYVAVVTFSMKPKVIQDFTNESQRLYSAVVSAYRDTLNFSESNIYDALSFTLLGGKAIQLYDESTGPSEYTGLQEIEGHTAVILITLGIDTFSRINYDKALKIASGSGVPIFTVGVGNLFFKKYEQYLRPEDRLTWLQAFNQLRSFAERTGGAYFDMTFEGQIPTIMRNIEILLRNQYSVGYVPSNTRRDGKERKIKVEVDVDGDGTPDNKQLELSYRQRYLEPGTDPLKK
ncbi:MAG TPA: VWA domain-containing protein [Blastocatellia bacterium]|nr:VWA domain-containing protein [Blastocatellia bacterium]